MKLHITLLVTWITLVASTAPLYHIDSKTIVPGQYIVVLQSNATVEIRDAHVAALSARMIKSEKVINTFNVGSFIGYTAALTKETLDQLLEESAVSYVEADQVVSLFENTVTQSGATWGLDRINQRNLPLNSAYSYFASAGTGVTAYVLDTGVLTTHSEFGNRATFGYTAISGEANTDLNGHGTHVAGTIGGVTYGVAKKVTIVAVKVLNGAGSGTTSGIVQGINYVTSRHTSGGASARSVANLSLGGAISTALDNAVAQSIQAGIVYAIAAGNSNANACNYSPARVTTAITVGATASNDARATFSNFGTCLDIFAPGQSITSAWIGSNTAFSTISGTSMAAPHVAGAVAVYYAHLVADGGTSVPTPAAVLTWLINSATTSVVSNGGTGSPNRLLYSPIA